MKCILNYIQDESSECGRVEFVCHRGTNVRQPLQNLCSKVECTVVVMRLRLHINNHGEEGEEEEKMGRAETHSGKYGMCGIPLIRQQIQDRKE